MVPVGEFGENFEKSLFGGMGCNEFVNWTDILSSIVASGWGVDNMY
jgi:hypothetical protein